MLIARGNTWKETEKQINESGYTGTTWQVYFWDADFPASFFTDLDEAREYARGIDAETMEKVFGTDADGQVIRVEEDEWYDGVSCEIGFCTWYGYEWKNGKWEVYC